MEIGAWLADHPVLEALWQRRKSGSTPANRSDDLRIGVAVEGGGMRGVVSAAMLCALEDLGMMPAFDAVYAASSGAINSAYFLTGDCWYPLSIYYDDLLTREFVDFRRFLRGNVLNLDYAYGYVVDKLKPLDYQAVIDSPIPLHIAVTLVDEIRTSVVHEFTAPADLREALVATAWLPVAVRGTAEFRGQRVVDGGVLTPHPFRLALQDGCTHVLSLSTRPIRPPRERYSLSQRYAARHLNRIRDGLGDAYLTGIAGYRGERRRLQQRMRDPGEPPYVLDLAPMPWMPEVSRHARNAHHIFTGAREAYEVMYCAIERRDPAAIRSGLVRAVPRLTVVARDDS